jgi:hypothetical protein
MLKCFQLDGNLNMKTMDFRIWLFYFLLRCYHLYVLLPERILNWPSGQSQENAAWSLTAWDGARWMVKSSVSLWKNGHLWGLYGLYTTFSDILPNSIHESIWWWISTKQPPGLWCVGRSQTTLRRQSSRRIFATACAEIKRCYRRLRWNSSTRDLQRERSEAKSVWMYHLYLI